ncbi:hypothetical protein LINGRAHAP2_LOCUS23683 [Linum grandiflorum]
MKLNLELEDSCRTAASQVADVAVEPFVESGIDPVNAAVDGASPVCVKLLLKALAATCRGEANNRLWWKKDQDPRQCSRKTTITICLLTWLEKCD